MRTGLNKWISTPCATRRGANPAGGRVRSPRTSRRSFSAAAKAPGSLLGAQSDAAHAGLPFLAHLLSRIHAAGIRDVVLATSFKGEPRGDGCGIRNVLDELTARPMPTSPSTWSGSAIRARSAACWTDADGRVTAVLGGGPPEHP